MSDRKMPDDRELEEFLAGRSEVSRRYRDAKRNETAPPELDQKVLDRAREALKQRRPRRARLAVPLALAASVVVTFSLVLSIREQHAELPQPAPMVESKAKPVTAAPVLDDRPRQAAEPQRRDELSAKKERDRGQVRELEKRAEPKAFAPAGASAPAAPQAAQAPAAKASADSAARVEKRLSLTAGALQAEEAASNPEAWIERIRALRDSGRVEDARRELEAFQRANPDSAIPDDLKPLLPSPPP